mgnify:CR=1 FL=1
MGCRYFQFGSSVKMLHEGDTDVSGVIQLKDYKETLSRTRDVIKKTAYGVEFVVLGIESQQHIHYACRYVIWYTTQ